MIYYNNWLKEDSVNFAIQVSDLCEKIDGCPVYVDQLLLSSSLIGVNISQTKSTQNKTDFIKKYEAALEQCLSTEYWLEIIYRKGKMSEDDYKNIQNKSLLIKRKLFTVINSTGKRLSLPQK